MLLFVYNYIEISPCVGSQRDSLVAIGNMTTAYTFCNRKEACSGNYNITQNVR